MAATHSSTFEEHPMSREPKTKVTEASVEKFLESLPDAATRDDCRAVAKLMQKVTKAKPKMWGTSIVGFGTRDYQGASGTSRWMEIGFSPRKANLTLYIMTGIERHPALFKKLGRFKHGKGCLYLKRLTDIDMKVLEEIITASVTRIRGEGG
jgi:hypothetical protein